MDPDDLRVELYCVLEIIREAEANARYWAGVLGLDVDTMMTPDGRKIMEELTTARDTAKAHLATLGEITGD